MDRKRVLDTEFQMPSMRLDGKVALVTGGSRGLGLAIAQALATSGASVAVAARNREELNHAVELIQATGAQATGIATDVGVVDEVRAMIGGTLATFGGLDILVNCAGVNFRRPVDTFSEDDWDKLMAINLKGAFFASQEAAQVMRAKKWGRIINIGSIAYEMVVPNVALYAISKGGMKAMTHAFAVELARDGITVNSIAPGRFWTQMTDAVFSKPDLYDSAVSVIPMERPGLPADLAGAAIMLASDAGSYITGQTIYVDGGWMVNGGTKA